MAYTAVLRNQSRKIYVLPATRRSYLCLSDVIETQFCTAVGYFIVAMATDLWRYLIYDSSGA